MRRTAPLHPASLHRPPRSAAGHCCARVVHTSNTSSARPSHPPGPPPAPDCVPAGANDPPPRSRCSSSRSSGRLSDNSFPPTHSNTLTLLLLHSLTHSLTLYSITPHSPSPPSLFLPCFFPPRASLHSWPRAAPLSNVACASSSSLLYIFVVVVSALAIFSQILELQINFLMPRAHARAPSQRQHPALHAHAQI